MRGYISTAGILLLLLLFACTTADDDNIVLTEDLIYVSSETARFSGRILSANDDIQDHGFEVSDNMDFTGATRLSLSEKSGLGLFVGEISSLSQNTDYFFRAYMETPDAFRVGEAVAFSTLSPNAFDFEPKVARPGTQMTIFGSNVTADIEVFFGNTQAEVADIRFESTVVVNVPTNSPNIRELLSVNMNGEVFELDTFEFTVGVWDVIEFDFLDDLGLNVFDGVALQTDTEFMFGMGFDNRGFFPTLLNERMFSLDFATWTWSEMSIPGSPALDPFVAGNVFGGGLERIVADLAFISRESWMATAGGFVPLSFVPANIYKGIGAEINGEHYVYAGAADHEGTPNIAAYKYDGVSWSVSAQHPVLTYVSFGVEIPISSDVPNFVINDRAYYVAQGSVWNLDLNTGILVEHDTAPFGNCLDAAYVTLNNKFYVGVCDGSSRDFWEYDPENKIWKEKTQFIANNNRQVVGSFAYDDVLYFLTSELAGPGPAKDMRMFSLQPDAFQ